MINERFLRRALIIVALTALGAGLGRLPQNEMKIPAAIDLDQCGAIAAAKGSFEAGL